MNKRTTAKDLIGKRSGKLEVIAQVPGGSSGKTALCRCDCGNEIAVTAAKIRLGRLKSCGCSSTSVGKPQKRVEDIIGKKFGMLTVIGRPDNWDGGAKNTLCRCDCGNLTEVNSSKVITGHTRSCGCLLNQPHAQVDDRIGEKFGRLTITARAPRDKHGHTKYETKCDCGNTITASWPNLRTGNTKSCGCLNIETARSAHNVPPDQIETRLLALLLPHHHVVDFGADYKDTKSKIRATCDRHGEFAMAVSDMLYKGTNPCFACGLETAHEKSATGTSEGEKEMRAFISSLGFDVEPGCIPGVSAWHFDALVDAKKIAFEYNGVYWHSYPRTQRGKHLIKRRACEEAGFRLVTIWEDDWQSNRDRMEALIRRVLLGADRAIGARKLSASPITPDAACAFHRAFHVQEFNSPIKGANFGLSRGDELVAAATFSRSGVLHRYTIKDGISITGGLRKLIAAFRRQYGPCEIVTYCDRDHFDGAVYKASGFELAGRTLTMSYVRGSKRVRREGYMKKKLKDVFGIDSLEGREIDICAAHNVFACWNSGTEKYVLR